MNGVRYTFANDPSGYGQAARSFITSLFVSGVNITLEPIKQMPESIDYGLQGNICKSLHDRKIPYKVKIIHLTPDIIPDYQEKGIYTIAHLFWETSHLPKEWIAPLNDIDEIWTASDQMSDMIRDSGVNTPCYVFPQPIDITLSSEVIEPLQTQYPKDFTFYSIFQFIDRKNPRNLLRAYWQAFEGNDDVTLLLKTYRITYLPQEYQLIKDQILLWKKELGLKHYPKVQLVHKVLTEEQMTKLHKMGDVFINPSSGEGWNRPMEEAMLFGKPVISGDNGGITDIMTSQYYEKVESHLVHATQQSWIPWYTSDMLWKELDEKDLIKQMRFVYENYAKAQEKAKKAQKFVVDNFNYLKVGQAMRERLEKIYRSLN